MNDEVKSTLELLKKDKKPWIYLSEKSFIHKYFDNGKFFATITEWKVKDKQYRKMYVLIRSTIGEERKLIADTFGQKTKIYKSLIKDYREWRKRSLGVKESFFIY